MQRHLPAVRPYAAEHSPKSCAAAEIGARPIGSQTGPTLQLLYAPHRLRSGLLIALADLLGFLLTWSITFAAARALSLHSALLTEEGLGKLICILMLLYLLSELYPGVAMHPADELKRLSVGTTLALLIALGLVIQPRHLSDVGIALITWAVALVTIPLCRMWMRRLGSAQSWWGVPTVILGAGRLGRRIANTLKKNPQLGLRPVGVLDDQTDRYLREGWSGDIPISAALARRGQLPPNSGSDTQLSQWRERVQRDLRKLCLATRNASLPSLWCRMCKVWVTFGCNLEQPETCWGWR